MFNKVLVPVDLQDTGFCLNALKIALREVQGTENELHLITVLPGYNNNLVSSFFKEKEHKAVLVKAAKVLMAFSKEHVPSDVNLKMKVFEGSASEEVNRYVQNKEIKLVVMRGHQRSKINEFLLGSVSSRVVERAHCSVFVLKD